MTLLLKIFIIIFFFSNSSNLLLAENNIAYLDLDYVLSKSNSGSSLLKQLNEIEQKNIKILSLKEDELKKEENEIKKIKNIISKNELEKKIQQLKVKLNSYNKLRNENIKIFKERRKVEVLRYMNLINPIIEKYMNNQSIDILLDKKNIFIAKVDYDITQKIIDIIDKEIKDFKIK
jgi:Skp family chaperone for outer membrane proteins